MIAVPAPATREGSRPPANPQPGRPGSCRRGRGLRHLAALIPFLVCAVACAGGAERTPAGRLEVPYEPTPNAVVDLMLETARVGPEDLVYDLGCGDGRIAIAAVRKYGARAVCIDIHPQRIREAREKAQHYGVSDRIRFVVGDVFQADLRPATVVAMYLTTRVNRWLRPKLIAQLAPGTRIVSHAFHLSEWKPDRVLRHPRARKGRVYYYVVPAAVAGRFSVELECGARRERGELILEQSYQEVTGHLVLGGRRSEIRRGQLNGRKLGFEFLRAGQRHRAELKVDGSITGRAGPVQRGGVGQGGACRFRATKAPEGSASRF